MPTKQEGTERTQDKTSKKACHSRRSEPHVKKGRLKESKTYNCVDWHVRESEFRNPADFTCRIRNPGVPTFYTNHLGGIPVHKHQTIKFDVPEGEQPATEYIKSAEQPKASRKRCIAASHSPHFLKVPKRNGAYHLIFQPQFPVFPCKWWVRLGFGVRTTAQGIRNPTNDWNPKSKFHWQRVRNGWNGIRNQRLSWISLHGANC